MPSDVAVQGLAQDLITLVVALPFLLFALFLARRGSRAAYLALTGAVGYIFVQYLLYLAMGTYNELFLVWVGCVLISFQVFVRLLLSGPRSAPTPYRDLRPRRFFVGGFLIINGILISLLWLGMIVPPLLEGTLYPPGLGHLTTLVVQGIDLAILLPPSLAAGYWYLMKRPVGHLLAPVYVVFLALQMSALLAKVLWMVSVGAEAGPALVAIPLLLLGAVVATVLALRGQDETAGATHPASPVHA